MEKAQVINELRSCNRFITHSLAYQGLSRPHLATKIIFDRIKFLLTKKPTIVKTKLFFGEEMILKFPDRLAEALYVWHFFEYNLSNIVLSYLKPGMIFADVGAHFGYFTLLASKIVSEKGMVHSFEPTKSTYEVLCMNAAGGKNIKTNQVAAWSSNTDLEFHDYGEAFSAFNSFTNPKIRNFDGKIKKITVKAITLDDYFQDFFPDFVKIDTESAELQVLKGMEKIIKDKRPYISIEVGDIVEGNPSSKKCVEYLLKKDYKPYEFRNDKINPHLIKDSYGYDNLFFMPE